jgi:hypothetical protein
VPLYYAPAEGLDDGGKAAAEAAMTKETS